MEKVMLCEGCEDPAECVERFRTALRREEMEVLLENSLAALPGSVHFHLRPQDERTGILEYTMDVRGGRSWLSWHANRYRPWIDRAVEVLRRG